MKKEQMLKLSAKYLKRTFTFSAVALTLGSAVLPISVQAAGQNTAVVKNNQVTAESSITYIDGEGQHVLAVPKDTVVKLSSTAKTITIEFGGEKYTLTEVSEITFNGITASALIPFYSDSVVKLAFENVDFTKGIDISGTKNLEELTVKNSSLGTPGYSFAIHGADNLTKLQIENSTFNADLRIYSNSNLESAQVINSSLKDDATQYSNKKGYYTDYSNCSFERSKTQKTISSGGKNADDIFYINKNGNPIGASKFNVEKDGSIGYKDENGEKQAVTVPAGETITKMTDSKNQIELELSNGEKATLEGVTELDFYNVNIATAVHFTQKGLTLNKVTFRNSITELIDIANSETIKEVQILGTEISQPSSYLSIYNNKALESVVIQNSEIKESAGYISVYNNKLMTNLVLTNVYAQSYLSAYNLGETVIQISNSQFDDYISTNQTIEGEGALIPAGELPVIEGAESKTIDEGSEFNPLEGISATDVEDGDITGEIQVDGKVDTAVPGEYELVYSVIDSDGNKAEIKVTITVISTNKKPTISGTTNVSVAQNSNFDALEGVTAQDEEDGDITSKIQVDGKVDTTVPGEYILTYTVTDSGGLTAEATRIVTVTPVNQPPVITGADDITINQGSIFDPRKDVVVMDPEDGDITESLEVSGFIDVNEPDVYTLIYTAVDSEGLTAEVSRVVTVLPVK